ncbi:MAG: class I SAM-dependent methyltransferase [Candidatus Cyclobacteriaceae bacterium M2_1C_046]
MNEIYTNCPLCKSGLFHDKFEVKDFSVSKEIFTICECENCKLLFTNPYPSAESIGPYYKSEEYISHTNKANTLVNILYKKVRNFTLQKKIRLVKNLNGTSLLDVGCGTGHFLYESYKQGLQVSGVETDKQARLNIPGEIKDKVYSSISKIPVNKKVDVITLWHVLEHLHNLQDSFKELNNHLERKGFFIIAVPNPSSYDAKHYRNKWAAWDTPRHLYHFRPEQVKLLFEQHNILLINILPMKFDSYYVSMLSEKYKGKNILNQMIFGMIYGFLSNFKASKEEYSSLIYIGQKK